MEKTISIATLYLPGAATSQPTSINGFELLDLSQNMPSGSIDKVAAVLGCTAELVDVLDQNASFIAFSIFDHEGEINREAMKALTKLSSHSYEELSEEDALTGPILIVQQVGT